MSMQIDLSIDEKWQERDRMSIKQFKELLSVEVAVCHASHRTHCENSVSKLIATGD
jgi:hypothetical protein